MELNSAKKLNELCSRLTTGGCRKCSAADTLIPALGSHAENQLSHPALTDLYKLSEFVLSC